MYNDKRSFSACGRPRNIILGTQKSFHFPFFWPPEAENDLLVEYTKKFFSKSVFFVFSERESFLASGGHKTGKTLFLGPKNPFFGRFLATRGQILPFNIKYKKVFSKSGFFVFYEEGSFLASGGHKMRKTLFWGLKNPFFFLFPASRGQK